MRGDGPNEKDRRGRKRRRDRIVAVRAHGDVAGGAPRAVPAMRPTLSFQKAIVWPKARSLGARTVPMAPSVITGMPSVLAREGGQCRWGTGVMPGPWNPGFLPVFAGCNLTFDSDANLAVVRVEAGHLDDTLELPRVLNVVGVGRRTLIPSWSYELSLWSTNGRVAFYSLPVTVR